MTQSASYKTTLILSTLRGRLASVARVPIDLASHVHHDRQHDKERNRAHEQRVILLPQSTFMASSLGVSLDQRSVGQRGQQTGLTPKDRLALGKGEGEAEGGSGHLRSTPHLSPLPSARGEAECLKLRKDNEGR